MKDYHLLLACDKYYLSYMFVACQSILNGIKNSTNVIQQDEQIVFDIIIDSSVNKEKASELAESFCKRNDFINTKFVFYNADENEFEEARGWCDHQTKSAFYRLLMDRFLPNNVHKLLYIDIDVLVLGDIRELINTSMEDSVLGTVYTHTYWRSDYNAGKLYLNPIKENNTNKTVTLDELDYFNSGVLLINLDQWRKENTGQRAIDFVHNYNPIVLDQDTLNYVTNNNLALDWSWNFQCWMFYIDKDSLKSDGGYVRFDSDKDKHQFKSRKVYLESVYEGLNSCNIVHFTYSKPWKDHPFIPDEGRHFLFNEQLVKALNMWQEIARQTPECVGVHIPNTTIASTTGDILNHTSLRLTKETKQSKKKRRELRNLFLSLIGVLLVLQIISIFF